MKYLKLYGISILIMLGIFLSVNLLLTTLSYFDLITDGMLSILQIITMFIVMFIGGFVTSKKCTSKGWKEGLKIGIIFIIILFLINILFIHQFDFKNIIYFIILIISSIFGGMIGILKK